MLITFNDLVLFYSKVNGITTRVWVFYHTYWRKKNNVFSLTARLEVWVLSVPLQCKQYSVVCAEPRRGYVQAKRCLSMASPMFVLAWEQEKKAIWPHWKSKGCLKLKKKKILVYFKLIFKVARRSPVPLRTCTGKWWPLLFHNNNRKRLSEGQ